MTEQRSNTSRKLSFLQIAAADPKLPAGTFRILFAISTFADGETGQAYPSQTAIAGRAGFTLRGVQDAIGALFSGRYVDKVEGGRGRANTYRLRLEIVDEAPRPDVVPTTSQRVTLKADTTTSKRGRTTTSGRGRYHAATCSNTFTNTLGEHEGENPPTPSRPLKGREDSDAIEAGFDRFWKAYPRREAKGAAQRAFAKAMRRVDLETLLAGVDRYATERRHEDPKFTRHPATWLNGDGWLDEGRQVHVLPSSGAAPSGGRAPRYNATVEYLKKLEEAKRVARTVDDLDKSFGHHLDSEAIR